MNIAEMAVLSGFWQKNDLGPLGIKHCVVIDREKCCSYTKGGYGASSFGNVARHFLISINKVSPPKTNNSNLQKYP